jgi:hypothetical protein
MGNFAAPIEDNGSPRPFQVEVDHDQEIITIQGIRYTFALFDTISFGAKGLRVEFGEREDGTRTLISLPQEAADEARDRPRDDGTAVDPDGEPGS